MLWPPPKQSEQVELLCACRATVVWRVPVMFLYRVRIYEKGGHCTRSGHIPGRRMMRFLEAVTRRVP